MVNYNFFESALRTVCEEMAYKADCGEASGGATPQRKYMDTVFRTLFQDKERLLSLYNAVSGRHYTDSKLLEIVTLENAIYLKVKNDIAFLIDFHLYLYEHQSTVNPNMPFRFLQYVTEEFSKFTAGKDLYGPKQLQFPAPHFIVFYNGREPQPEERILRLSDAYKNTGGEVQLELLVKVLNINDGFNETLKEQCQSLKEYMQFVNRVRKYRTYLLLEEAMNLAVEECMEEGILEEFLRENQHNTHLWAVYGEYDEEMVKRDWMQAGYEDGKADSILELLENIDVISDEDRNRIKSQTDLTVLSQWLKSAAKAKSLFEWKELVDWRE